MKNRILSFPRFPQIDFKHLDAAELLSIMNCFFISELHSAVWNRDVHFLKTLLQNGRGHSQEKNGPWGRNMTALHCAAFKGATECVELLLDKGAYVNARTSDYSWTPLMYAASKGNIECVRLLINRGKGLSLACYLPDQRHLVAGRSCRGH